MSIVQISQEILFRATRENETSVESSPSAIVRWFESIHMSPVDTSVVGRSTSSSEWRSEILSRRSNPWESQSDVESSSDSLPTNWILSNGDERLNGQMRRIPTFSRRDTPGLCCCSALRNVLRRRGWRRMECFGHTGLETDQRFAELFDERLLRRDWFTKRWIQWRSHCWRRRAVLFCSASTAVLT